MFEINALEFMEMLKIEKNNNDKSSNKKWDKSCPIWVFLGQNFTKIFSYLKSAPSNLSNCKFCEGTKMPKFGTKNTLFRYFWARILKSYCHISNQHPEICQIAKFPEKTKITKFATKNALFGYFQNRILKNYSHV